MTDLIAIAVAMAAGLAQLKLLRDTPGLYKKLNRAGDEFFATLDGILNDAGVPHCTNHVGSLGSVFFTPEKVRDYAGAQTSDTGRYTAYFKHMLDSGVYLAPSQFEAMFLSTAHTPEDLQKTLDAVREFLK